MAMRIFDKLIIFFATISFVAINIPQTSGSNILGVFTSHSDSHLIVHMSIMKALAEKGHNVTVVTNSKPKVMHKSINNIIIPISAEHENELNEQLKLMTSQKNTVWTMLTKLTEKKNAILDLQFDLLKDPRFTRLHDTPDTKFDLLFLGYFMNEFQVGLAAKFKCPMILNWMGAPTELTDYYVGNPSEISYVPSFFIVAEKNEVMGFMKRLQNFIISWMTKALKAYMDFKARDKYNELFGNDESVPPYDEMKKNVSLLFCNSHFSEGPIRPNVPAIVEIGGIQIKEKPDPLPEDIGEFLASAKTHGAILFSLGSNLKSASINPNIAKTIFKVLSSLKQKVIWKWEDLENTPGKSANILYKKWLPQDDILAHPNMKLFITHAGKGGIAESQYHGVPMVALPVFGDQVGNAGRMSKAGYGLQLELLTLKEDEFKAYILEVLTNKIYGEKVKAFSKLYRDRPMTAKENVVYWTEYVLRHHGAKHMQSPLVHLNYFQSESWDVIAVLLAGIYLVFKITKIIGKCICRVCCGKRDSKLKIADKNKKKIKKT